MLLLNLNTYSDLLNTHVPIAVISGLVLWISEGCESEQGKFRCNPQKVLLTGFSNCYIQTNHKANHIYTKTGLLLDEVTLIYVPFFKNWHILQNKENLCTFWLGLFCLGKGTFCYKYLPLLLEIFILNDSKVSPDFAVWKCLCMWCYLFLIKPLDHQFDKLLSCYCVVS